MRKYNIKYFLTNVDIENYIFFRGTRGKEKIRCKEITFDFFELNIECQKKLIELFPNIVDTDFLDLTVDINKITNATSYVLRKKLFTALDFISLYGIEIDIETITLQKGNVTLDTTVDLNSNRAIFDKPYLEILIKKDGVRYITFRGIDTIEQIIDTLYSSYALVIKYLSTKFLVLEKNKIILQKEYDELYSKENLRLKQLGIETTKLLENYKIERKKWIKTHGSKYLNFLLNRGKDEDFEELYVKERLESELSGWILDYNNEITYIKIIKSDQKTVNKLNNVIKNGYTANIITIKRGNDLIKTKSNTVLIHK